MTARAPQETGGTEDSTAQSPTNTYTASTTRVFTAVAVTTDSSGVTDGRETDSATASICLADLEEPSDQTFPANIGVGYAAASLSLCTEDDIYRTAALTGQHVLCLYFDHSAGNIDVLVFTNSELTQVAGGGVSVDDNEVAVINGVGVSYYVRVYVQSPINIDYKMRLASGNACPAAP